MEEGIFPTNSLLEKLIGDMIDISCTAIYNMYNNYRNIPIRDTPLLKGRHFMPDLVAYIIGDLFTVDRKKRNVL